MYWTYEVLHKSLIFQKGEKIAEILLKIIQYTNKNNINTLKETQSLFSNMQGDGEPGDLFFKIGKNIKDMDEEQLYALSRVLDILPEEAKTEDILFFIIGMDEYMLVDLYLLLCSLPENEKTKEILLNMSKMDTEILSFDFFIILCSLSSKELTQDKILNISRMDKDELRDLRFGIDCDEILEIY